MVRRALTALILLIPALGYAKPPAWFNVGQRQVARSLHVSCIGTGPSLALARSEAINSCKSVVVDKLAQEYQVQSLVVESEHHTGFHREVSQDHTVTGLTYKVTREQVEELDSSYKVYQRVAFDLTNARTIPLWKKEPIVKNRRPMIQRSGIRRKNTHQLKDATYTTDETKRLSITSVPKCDSILVRGRSPRKLPCKENPLTILLKPNDSTLILRAKGYQPKTIRLSPDWSNIDEEITIIFD